jgi:hypothetical protein
MERFLKGRQTPGISQTFDRRDSMAVGLHCQYRAGFDRSTVQPHGARTTLRRVATDVRSSKASLLAQKVNQQQAWFDVSDDPGPVDVDRYRMALH